MTVEELITKLQTYPPGTRVGQVEFDHFDDNGDMVGRVSSLDGAVAVYYVDYHHYHHRNEEVKGRVVVIVGNIHPYINLSDTRLCKPIDDDVEP